MSFATTFMRAFGGNAGSADAARAASNALTPITTDLSVVDARLATAPVLPYHAHVAHTVTPGMVRVPVADPAGSSARAVIARFGPEPGMVARAAMAGTTLRAPSREHVARVESVLSRGEPMPLSVRRTAIPHANGLLARVDLVDPSDATAALPAFRKPTMQAAQERFGWQLLDTLRAGHLGAPVALRSDGTAMVAAIDGAPMSKEGVHSYADLEASYRSLYDHELPELPAADRAQAARVDRQLVQFADWFIANSDRSGGNGVRDGATGHGAVFDWGNAGIAEQADPLRPHLSNAFPDANAPLQLDDATLDVIRARLTPDVVARLHAELASNLSRELPGDRPPLFHGVNQFLGSQRYLGRLQARLAHVRAGGLIQGSDTFTGVRPADLR